MELDQDREDDASPPEMAMPSPNTESPQVHEASRMRLLGASGNGLAAASTVLTSNGELASVKQEPRLGLEMRFPNLSLMKARKPVRYRECLKNHAASLGGHAVDGCGEFMASGAEGSLEALKCAACDCHRNFHRQEMEGEMDHELINRLGPLLTAPPQLASRPFTLMPALPDPHRASQMIMATVQGGGRRSDLDDRHGNAALSTHLTMQSSGSAGLQRKRFRTKFSSEQKDKMWDFAEKLGWRIQKHDEPAVLQFCSEAGVKRHVLKVWMHNNKNALSRKPPSL